MGGKHLGSCSCSSQEEKAFPACVGVGVEARLRESWVEVEETLSEAEAEGGGRVLLGVMVDEEGGIAEVMVLGESKSSHGSVSGGRSADVYGLCVIGTEILNRFDY